MDFIALVVIMLVFIIGASIMFSKKTKQLHGVSSELSALKLKYQPIADIQKEVDLKKEEVESFTKAVEELKVNYKTGIEQYNTLKKSVETYENEVEIIEYGLYKPIFNYDDSEKYKIAIGDNYQKQKDYISNGRAIVCETEWTVEGSAAKGAQMVKKNMKLMLRAFNGECDALIAKAKWNNVKQLEERIKKAFEIVNQLGSNTRIEITTSFLKLKMDELHLAYEYEKKKYDEKEEQRLIKEQMREEERVRREIEQATKQAEDEEKRYEKALEKAREDVSNAVGAKHDKLIAQIQELEQRLKVAEENKERALSMAQQTKAGHVYIISNIGSFGEDVYKIGMTRRLEPLDRVKELGDASVPFEFDVHGMIYSENAPELETFLHKAFDSKRVNLVNAKKEFFNVTLGEIEQVISDRNVEVVELTKLAEAREYRESVALRENIKLADPAMPPKQTFPQELVL